MMAVEEVDMPRVSPGVSALRLALAVRGWSRPHDLVASEDASWASAILDAISRDVIVDVAARPGHWWLKTEARQRVFATSETQDIAAAVRDGAGDEISQALTFLLDGRWPNEALASMTDVELRALAVSIGWLADPASLSRMTKASPEDVERLGYRVSALEAVRSRLRDVSKMNAQAVGFDALSARVFSALFEGPRTEGPIVAYVWGLGGNGKSTLLADVERKACQLSPTPLVVHIDFDRAVLDPTKPQTLTLELLRQAGADSTEPGSRARDALMRYSRVVADQARAPRPPAPKGRARSVNAARIKRIVEVAEGVELESLRAERSIDFYDALSGFGERFRQLFLVLDTIETLEPVAAGGAAAMGALEDWIARISRSSGIADVRVLAAGRRPRHPTSGADKPAATWFANFPHVLDFELPELTSPQKREILERADTPAELVADAAANLVGNPLIVRMAADTARMSGAAASELRAEWRSAGIDGSTARRYLEERVLKHVPEAWAHPFVIGAFAFPELTPRLIETVLLPTVRAVSDPSPALPVPTRPRASRDRFAADALFRVLARSTWLTIPKISRKSLSIRPEVRNLVEPLIAADIETRELTRTIHAAAANFYETDRSGAGIRLAKYHKAASLGQEIEQAQSPTYIRTRARMLTPDPITLPNVDPLDRAEWYASFEQTSLKMLETGKARSIVEQWKARPRNLRLPTPDVVLRSLADIGDFFSPLVDLGSLLGRIDAWDETPHEGHLRFKASLADLLPMTLARAKHLGDRRRLAHAIDRVSEHASSLEARDFDAVVAAAFVLGRYVEKSSLLRLADQAGRSSYHRGALLLHRVREARDVMAYASHLVVAQRDFDPSPNYLSIDAPLPLSLPEDASDLRSIDRHYSNLKSVMCDISIGRPELPAVALWLRGVTTELHSPLRYTLEDCWLSGENDEEAVIRLRVHRLVAAVTKRMTILPREFEEHRFWRNVEFDAGAWFGAFVRFTDNARLLRWLADNVLEIPHGKPGKPWSRLHDVARQIVLWDRALTSGGDSSWPANGGQE